MFAELPRLSCFVFLFFFVEDTEYADRLAVYSKLSGFCVENKEHARVAVFPYLCCFVSKAQGTLVVTLFSPYSVVLC